MKIKKDVKKVKNGKLVRFRPTPWQKELVKKEFFRIANKIKSR